MSERWSYDHPVRYGRAVKLWGHGRLRQTAARAWCLLVGHRWGEPFRDEIVICTCQRRCGTVADWPTWVEDDPPLQKRARPPR